MDPTQWRFSKHESRVDTGSLSGRIEVDWKRTFEAGLTTNTSYVGNTVYFGTGDGRIRAVDESTGEDTWASRIGATPILAITVNDDRLYALTEEEVVFCLDRGTGNRQWRFDVGAQITSPIVSRGPDVVFGTGDKTVLSLNANTGNQQWEHSIPGHVESPPAVAAEAVVVRDHIGATVALDRQSGEERWRQSSETGLPFGTFRGPIVRDDRVYLSLESSGSQRQLAALGLEDGSPVWKRDILGCVGQLALGPQRLYSIHGTGIYALDPADGTALWNVELNEQTLELDNPIVLVSVRGALYTESTCLPRGRNSGHSLSS